MIDREKLNKLLDARDALEGIVKVEVTIYESGNFRLWVTPMSYYAGMTEDERHKTLAILTPLIGKLEMQLEGTDKWFRGEMEGLSITVAYADKCKVIGYKTITKTVKKEIEKPVEYEEVEEEVRVPITDCDIRQGKYSDSDIEVTA